jgi:S-adenosylmethionine decarboxylase
MQGLHLTADLHGCPTDQPVMTDTDTLRKLCLAAVHAAGLAPVGELFYRFTGLPGAGTGLSRPAGIAGKDANTPVGITGVVLLAESHLAVHTWPEIAAVTLDVYVCNLGADNSERAHTLMAALVAAFEPAQVQRHALQRGRPGAPE